jgi:hypothetical protein
MCLHLLAPKHCALLRSNALRDLRYDKTLTQAPITDAFTQYP